MRWDPLSYLPPWTCLKIYIQALQYVKMSPETNRYQSNDALTYEYTDQAIEKK